MGCSVSSGLTGSGARVPSRQVRCRRGAAALGGGFWSSAYSFSHAGRELVLRFGACKDWFEADRAALAFASPDLPVPEVAEVGEAFDGAYAISVRCYGINLEDVRPDQSDAAGPMLASLLAALFEVPKSSDLPVGWHWRPPRRDLTWRGWLSGRLADDPRQEVHGWRAALAVQSGIDRVYRAAEARVRDLIEACPGAARPDSRRSTARQRAGC